MLGETDRAPSLGARGDTAGPRSILEGSGKRRNRQRYAKLLSAPPEMRRGIAGSIPDDAVQVMLTRLGWAKRVGRIERAIDGFGLETVFQPIVDLRTGMPAGYEALSRFGSGSGASLAEWFADAHLLGLGEDLELQAIRSALQASDTSEDEMFLAVNASPSVIESPDFLTSMESFDPTRIVVEVTEHAPIDDYDAFRLCFGRLRRRGVRLAVDDSGAGHASLRRIIELAPDLIKLDMALTRGIDSDPTRQAMVAAMVKFAHETGTSIVIEGVETEDELRTVKLLGATYAQGYWLGRPAPPRDLSVPAVVSGRFQEHC